jgi:cytochrome oxidase Cu insertion factor (SCO1/SenC/PrrC family)
MNVPAFGGGTPADEIAAYIDTVRRTPAQRDALVGLLAEQSPVYAGRSTNEAERLRGYVLASFETTGLPPAALAYVCEELESGQNPYTVAAAAKAIRGADIVPDRLVSLLLRAIDRIRPADDAVSFDSYPSAPSHRPPTTALMELIRTLAWLGPRAGASLDTMESMLESHTIGFSAAVQAEIKHAINAVSRPEAPAARSCCASGRRAAPVEHATTLSSVTSAEENVENLELQDQNGALVTFGEFFYGRPSIITFFYTRCMNPDKCSLTITKLARLQGKVSEQDLKGQINVAGVTYDPAFDLPQRLHAYGADRGMIFDDRTRLLRTTGPFEPLQRRFDLGVGFGSVTVNRHRLELVVLDDVGRATSMFTRMLWHEDEVLDAARAATPL